MPRKLIDCDLSSAATRRALAKKDPKKDTFWHEIKLQSLALGWRRNGQWVVRRYYPDTGYKQWALRGPDRTRCIADDHVKPNGVDVLSYRQAEERALEETEPAKPQEKGALTVREACEDYVNNHLAKRKKRSLEIAGTFKLQVYPTLGNKIVRGLTRTDLEQWLHARAACPKSNGKPRSHSDCNRTLSLLKAALNRAYEDEANDIPSDRVWKGVKPFPDVSRPRSEHYLDPGEVARLLAVTRGGLRDLIKGAFLIGCRPPHELAWIKAQHFNAERGTVEIAKSKTGSRVVTLSAEATAFLAELCAGKAPHDLLFLRDKGRPWVDGDGHAERVNSGYHVEPFRRAVARAGLPPKTSLYTLRHSFISLAIAAGGNLFQIAKNAGTSVEMIEKHYGHVRDDDARRMVEAYAPKLGLRVVA